MMPMISKHTKLYFPNVWYHLALYNIVALTKNVKAHQHDFSHQRAQINPRLWRPILKVKEIVAPLKFAANGKIDSCAELSTTIVARYGKQHLAGII